MKPVFFSLLFSICVYNFSSAQNPLVKMWDARFGGMNDEYIFSIQQTADGGYILGGFSISTSSGNKTQNSWGSSDYWIVKTDSLGNKLWDIDIGGTDIEQLHGIQQTTDGGYILGGSSSSNIGGNKTQPTQGLWDYWIVKTDSLGNKLWDKDFGGTDYDRFYSIQQTTDGGYILGGISTSNISGDKTQNSWGFNDYWIVKTDSLGNRQWDKDFGGTDEDWLYSIEQTSDGGYILGGISNSNISGDKTQNPWGSYDYWIVKTDSLGNKQWDKDLGGMGGDILANIHQTSDGGFILGGLSSSNIGGDKTQNTWGGGADYWIVKTDSLGNKLWDKDFGGTGGEDDIGNIIQTDDHGFIITGTSYSPISGDKTEANMGSEQTWLVKTDSLGNKQWDKTIFTNGHDEWGLAIQTKDGCYAVASHTKAGIAGYKTQPSWNNFLDYWIVKLCDSTQSLFPIAGFSAPVSTCPGTCINFLNLSTNATFYQWVFPGAIPDSSNDINPANICYNNPGNYDVVLIASNANGSDTLLLTNYLTIYPPPPPQSITQSNDSLFAIAGSSSYQWYFDGNIIPGATDYFYVATQSGDYNVVATDSNACEVEAAINNVLANTTPLSFGEGSGVRLFPNPVSETLSVIGFPPALLTNGAAGLSEAAKNISVYNLMGEKMKVEFTPLSPSQGFGGEADCRPLSTGLYYLELKAGEKIFRTKFVKQ